MKFWKKLENLFAATAFAEEGEFETARQMAGDRVSEGAPGAAEREEKGEADQVSRHKSHRGSRSRAA